MVGYFALRRRRLILLANSRCSGILVRISDLLVPRILGLRDHVRIRQQYQRLSLCPRQSRIPVSTSSLRAAQRCSNASRSISRSLLLERSARYRPHPTPLALRSQPLQISAMHPPTVGARHFFAELSSGNSWQTCWRCGGKALWDERASYQSVPDRRRAPYMPCRSASVGNMCLRSLSMLVYCPVGCKTLTRTPPLWSP
jgi:hypothetical protein